MPEMVEVSPGYFIERKRFDELSYLKVPINKMRDFIETRMQFHNSLKSMVGKPLKNQERRV